MPSDLELTWLEDIYQNQALPKVNEISRQYDSSGFVGRRDEDPSVVVKKWANSGLRDLLLDPNVTKGAILISHVLYADIHLVPAEISYKLFRRFYQLRCHYL